MVHKSNKAAILFLTIQIVSVFLCVVHAQSQYKIIMNSPTLNGQKMYIGRHFRDKYIIIDSSQAQQGMVAFVSQNNIDRGVYALLSGEKKKIFDFVVDDSRFFSIAYDSIHSNAGMKVDGSEANRLMYSYMARLDDAQKRGREMNDRIKKGNEKAKNKARKELENLSTELERYEKNYMTENSDYLFTRLISMFSEDKDTAQVPPHASKEDLQRWKSHRTLTTYWDKVDFKDHSLIYTPQLFDKMNYYFFNLLYYAESDTIIHYTHKLLDRMEGDSTMMRYVLDFIMPPYERSTRNIGWDQVFVSLVEDYYLKGKCRWATAADLYNKRQTIEYLKPSLIGAIGQELLMADTNQSNNTADWLSSHALPQKYVILWFWDPDCSHCKRQTAELAHLYDSLENAGNRQIEVYAVGYENDTEKWIRYVRQHRLPFVNVGGTNVNINYIDAYNVHGAPTMIILDADRRIIMNKNIPTNSILPFIEDYEARHPEQRDRKPSVWQQRGMAKKMSGKK